MQPIASGLSGSIVALATPFRRSGIDNVAFAALCARQVQRGSAALVVAGSTGEGPSLSLAEHARLVAIAREMAGALPVIAGVCAASTELAVALARNAAREGADALLCAPPPYVRPSQLGVIAHMRAVAHAADLPVMLYDVPGRVGVAVEDATIATLFERELIFAIKDAAGDPGRPVRLRTLCGTGLAQFSGDDQTALLHLGMGGRGCVSVTANLVPALCARMHRAWADRLPHVASGLDELLAPLHQALFLESNPIPLKAALHSLGLAGGALRLPLTRALAATSARLQALLPELMRLEDAAAGLAMPRALPAPAVACLSA